MNHTHPCRRATGFTLVELLAVVAIMAVIMALVIPASTNIGAAANLTNGVNTFTDQMNLARQVALSQSRITEVRFYSMNGAAGSGAAYRAMRTYVYDSSGSTATAAGATKYLPAGIIMVNDATGKFSSLLPNSGVTTALKPLTGTENLPGTGSTSYVAVQFRPTGGTNLDPNGTGSDKWFVSFKVETAATPAGGAKPANNFVTALIDPVSGRVRIFRP